MGIFDFFNKRDNWVHDTYRKQNETSAQVRVIDAQARAEQTQKFSKSLWSRDHDYWHGYPNLHTDNPGSNDYPDNDGNSGIASWP